MITARFIEKNKRRYELFIYGHANFDSYGQDIVCSAVSALSTAVLNEIHASGLNITMTKTFHPVEGNEIHVELIGTHHEISNEYEVKLLNMLKVNLQEIEQQYPDNIKVVFESEQ